MNKILILLLLTKLFLFSSSNYVSLVSPPIFENNKNIIVIPYDTHLVYFDTEKKVPLLVEYQIKKEELVKLELANSSILRSTIPFTIEKDDKLIPTDKQYKPSEYINLDIDRGHLLPYANGGLSREDKQNINKMTNIVPQNRGLNRGCWRLKEKDIKTMVELNNTKDFVITISVGVIFTTNQKIANLNYPDYFYMFIQDKEKKVKHIYLYPNKKPEKGTCNDIKYTQITEEYLEDLAKIDIYPNN